MKLKKFSVIIILFMIFTARAYSWDLGLGVTSYYSYWEPAYLKEQDNPKIDPALMIGPILSLQFFKDWTLGFQGLINANKIEDEYSFYTPGIGNTSVVSEISRLEAEFSLMYSFSQYIKFFCGYKHFKITEDKPKEIDLPAGYTSYQGDWYNDFDISGTGAGIAFSLPLVENLKATLSSSILYFNMGYNKPYVYGSTPTLFIEKHNYSYHGYGNNTTFVFTYFFPSIDTAISAGARCQYIKYKSEGDAPDLDSDLNYGVTLSVMYFI